MRVAEPNVQDRIASYEGLIFRTAQKLREPLTLVIDGERKTLPAVTMEQEDVEQILRLKLWRALRAFKPDRIRKRGETRIEAENRYVFMCLTDQGKDLRKRKRTNDLHLEDLAPADMDGPSSGVQSRDRFEQRYLSSSEDSVYGHIEDEGLVLPSTLNELEVQVVVLLTGDWKQAEVARRLSIERREMEKVMRSIRLKLADWKPSGPLEPQLTLIMGDGLVCSLRERAAA